MNARQLIEALEQFLVFHPELVDVEVDLRPAGQAIQAAFSPTTGDTIYYLIGIE